MIRRVTRVYFFNIASLGGIFGPLILRPKEESVDSFSDTPKINVITKHLIDYCGKIFTVIYDQVPYLGFIASYLSPGIVASIEGMEIQTSLTTTGWDDCHH